MRQVEAPEVGLELVLGEFQTPMLIPFLIGLLDWAQTSRKNFDYLFRVDRRR
jgi:hypothetical protein